jgi:type IV secretory pathway TrbD component
MHDVIDGWGDDAGFGVPVFVVTHRLHQTMAKGDTTFEFVTDGGGASRGPVFALVTGRRTRSGQ